MQSNADTPRKEFTCQGLEGLTIIQPIEEGHPCSGNEAASLNQTLIENMRNNFASAAKKFKEEADAAGVPVSLSAVQSALDAAVETYEFGVRRGRAQIVDPVEREATEMATKHVRDKLKSMGKKLSEIDSDVIDTYVKSALDKYPLFRQQAQLIVDARSEVAIEIPLDLE